jgi:hypothetical protein
MHAWELQKIEAQRIRWLKLQYLLNRGKRNGGSGGDYRWLVGVVSDF